MAVKTVSTTFFALLSALFFLPVLVSVLGEALWPADLFAMTVKALPGGLDKYDGITDFFIVLYMVHQGAVAGFTRQIQMARPQHH